MGLYLGQNKIDAFSGVPTTPRYDGTVEDWVTMPVKGDIISMNLGNTGSYDIGLGTNSYRVLDINGTVAKVLAMYEANNSTAYNVSSKTIPIGGYTVQKYNGSDLDIYLNQTWYNALNATAKAAIVSTDISQGAYYYYDEPNDHTQSPYTYQYEYSRSGESVDDENANRNGEGYVGGRKVFALDLKDIFDYHGSSYLRSNDLMRLFYNADRPSITTYPWLRSAQSDDPTLVWLVNADDAIFDGGGANDQFAARPAFCIDLSQITFIPSN